MAMTLTFHCSRAIAAATSVPLLFVSCKTEPAPARSRSDDKTVSFSYGKLETPPSDGIVVQLLSRVAPIVMGSLAPGRFALFDLDTGSFVTTLTSSEAARLELSVRDLPEIRVLAHNGVTTSRRCVRVDRLSFGNIAATDLDAIVLDLPVDIAGILGVSVFGEFPLLFDASRGHVCFLPTDSVETALQTRYPGKRWSRLPIRWEGTLPWVDLTTDNFHLRMLLDTGSRSSSILPSAARDRGLQSVGKENVVEYDAAGEHMLELEVFRLNGVQLGNWTCNLETGSADNAILRESQLDGILGFDLLGQIPFVFDARSGFLWVLDPPAGVESVLRSSEQTLMLALFQDPLSLFRKIAAISVMETQDVEFLSNVAALLDDDVAEVQEAAAAALSSFAHESWPEASRLAAARAWWKQHENDHEYRHGRENTK